MHISFDLRDTGLFIYILLLFKLKIEKNIYASSIKIRKLAIKN